MHRVRAPTQAKRVRCTLDQDAISRRPARRRRRRARRASAGCRRAPLAGSGGEDARPDLPIEAPSRGDGRNSGLDAPLDAARDIAADLDDDDTADALDAGTEAPDAETDAHDAGTEAPDAADAPADRTSADVPPDATAQDRVASDGGDVRPEDQPCGSLGNCAPFACDVARGLCKTTCATNDDCVAARTCIRGTCGVTGDPYCSSNTECNSGFCAQGVCCATACNQLCFSCAVPGSTGVCSPIWNGAPEVSARCPTGQTCDGRGQCIPPSCAIDTDCGPSHWCVNAHCSPCAATCVTDAECAAGALCVNRNGCTYCGLRDAGTG